MMRDVTWSGLAAVTCAFLGFACTTDGSDADSGPGGLGGTTSAGGGGQGAATQGGSWGQGGSAQGGSAQGGVGGTAQGGTGGMPLNCDSGFSFSPSSPVAGTPFVTSYTHSEPFVYVALDVSGAGAPSSVHTDTTGSYTWEFNVSGHQAGVLTARFLKDKNGGNPGVEVAKCEVRIQPSGSGGTGGASGAGGTGGTAGTGGTSGMGGAPPTNRYGIGYVGTGDNTDHDLAKNLAGPGGHVLVIFADITPGRQNADQGWKDAISALYARDLIPVIRMAPPWGNRNVRNMADSGSNHRSYNDLAKAYRRVIEDLPKRADWPMYVHVHNETNLCYEWECDSGTITGETMAREYAHLVADVADELHAIGDSRIRVTNGALAPGGVVDCQCGGSGFTPGWTSIEYLNFMKAEVPDVFDKIDVFSTHSYPASGKGFGFFVPYDQAGVGLKYFEDELAAIGKPNMKVLVTETGWTISHEGMNHSRDQVGDWTVQAYQNVWETHPNILGVMPFILRDSAWDNFAWAQTNGSPYPVYNKVRAHRCSKPGAQNCN